jgi:hypothetical protein
MPLQIEVGCRNFNFFDNFLQIEGLTKLAKKKKKKSKIFSLRFSKKTVLDLIIKNLSKH